MVGDVVHVALDLEVFKTIHESHGLWGDRLIEVCVHSVCFSCPACNFQFEVLAPASTASDLSHFN